MFFFRNKDITWSHLIFPNKNIKTSTKSWASQGNRLPINPPNKKGKKTINDQMLKFHTPKMPPSLQSSPSIGLPFGTVNDFACVWRHHNLLFSSPGTSSECESATRINGTKFKSNGEICPEFSWLVPALTAGYLLMANVLLLNLLIAIFT